MRSDDNGEHWSASADLGTKKPNWYATACNVWRAKGNVYLVMERRVREDNKSGWTIGNLAPVLMRAHTGGTGYAAIARVVEQGTGP